MKSKSFLYLYSGLVLLYFALVVSLPINTESLAEYNISESAARLLLISFAVPGIIIWYMSLYGFLKFREYSMIVKKEKEGPALKKLVSGLMVLSFSLPINSILSILLDFFAYKNPNVASIASIIKNYLTLVYQLAAFSLIAKGAIELRGTIKRKRTASSQSLIIAALVFSSTFTWLIVASPFSHSTKSIYNLPDWIVVFTVIIPYLITWYMGAVAVRNLTRYRRDVKGIIYKQSLTRLTRGIGLIVSLSIGIQLLATLIEGVDSNDVRLIVVIVYVLLMFYALSFGLVASGARRLKKLEEV